MSFSLRTDTGFALAVGGLAGILSLFLAEAFDIPLPAALATPAFHILIALLWLAFVPFGAWSALMIAKRLPQEHFPFYRFFRYGLIGGLNTVLNLSVFNALMLASGVAKGYLVVFFSVVAYVVTVTHSFLWNKFIIFEHRESGAAGQYVRFFLVSAFTGVIVTFFIHLLVNVIGAPHWIEPRLWANLAVLAGIPISVIGNFAGYSLLVFKKKPQ